MDAKRELVEMSNEISVTVVPIQECFKVKEFTYIGYNN